MKLLKEALIEPRFKVGLNFARIMILVILVLVLGGVWQAFAAPAPEPALEQVQAPQASLYAVSWNTSSITADTYSSAYLTQAYSYHDLYCDIDVNASQTLTIKILTSPDNSIWYTATTFTLAQSADTVVFTRCLSYGRYEKLYFDVESANQVTPTCKSVFFNNWIPANYVEQF